MTYDTNDSDERTTDSDLTENTRRSFLVGSAGAVGGFALAGAPSAVAAGGEHGDDDDEDHTMTDEVEAVEEDPFEDDVDILNYALTLEHLEAAFYEEALETIPQDELFGVEPLTEVSDDRRDFVWDEIVTIRDHEQIHADTLEATIEDLGGEAIERPEFDFGTATEDAQEFLTTAALLEDTGVGAYAGAAPFIENEDIVPPALSIHSVEGRHASYVRALDGETGYPEAFDEALSRDTVLERASGFIVDPPEAMADAMPEANGDADTEEYDDGY